jgi:uncharacterized protein
MAKKDKDSGKKLPEIDGVVKKKTVKKTVTKIAADKTPLQNQADEIISENKTPSNYKPSVKVKSKVIKKTAIKKIKNITTIVTDEDAEETQISATKFIKAEAKDTEVEVKPQILTERHETTIPEKYGDDRIVLMTRDPNWCYVYWDLSIGLMESKRKTINEKYDLVLRVYDITDVNFNGSNSHKFIDIQVSGEAGNWYINVWEAGRSYVVDIGYKTASGKFVLLSRSNPVIAPTEDVSPHTDEEWMIVDEDFEEIFRISGGGDKSRSPMGSSEGLKDRLKSDLSSGNVSSFSNATSSSPNKKNRGFFLNADTELILYGNTEKDAKLTVKGEKVDLKPDGSFSLRFHLPNGTIKLPVEAVSADKVDKITIKISVERKTE